MKKALLLLTLLSITITQAQTIQWQKALGGTQFEKGHCIQQTTDQGCIIAGYTNSNIGNHGDVDAWIVKLDGTGTLQWQKCLGGTDEDYATSIQQTNDGGYIIAGSTTSNDGDVTGNHGGSDYWIVKLDATGTILWQKTFGGTSYDKAESIRQTSDGGYIITGYAYSNDGDVTGNHGAIDIWIVKLDGIGTIQWQKCLGGTDDDYARSIQQTTDGGYIIAGGTNSNNGNVSGNHGALDFWIIKLDGTGTIQWKKCLGGTDEDSATSIQQTTDGGYIITGNTGSTNGDITGNHAIDNNIKSNDYWIVKLDGTGTIQWQKCLGGTGDEDPYSIQQTIDGGYIVAGNTTSNDGNVSGIHGSNDVWIVKLNITGNIQWQKCLGGSGHDFVYSNQQTADGGYIMTGLTNSNDGDVSGNNGNYDAWTIKLSPVVLGLTDNTKSTIKLYPNPAHESLQLQTKSPITAIKITDLSGKIVKEESLNLNNKSINQINIESLTQGMYILEAYNSSEKYTQKFLKK
jgi:hypothetical protein